MMNLHLDKNNFEGAIVAAANYFGIPEIFIEKDYWITYALHQFFHSEVKKLIVFKGGTSLSKCYNVIQRFSEDIDIVVVKNDSDSGNALKERLKDVTNVIDKSILEVVPDDPNTNKKGSIRKIIYSFPKVGVKGTYGEVRENIALEVSHVGNTEPNHVKKIGTLIADYIKTTPSTELIAQFGLEDFEVRALAVERTLCEKIISLVRFSYTENPLEDLANKVRHTYDLTLLMKFDNIKDFVNSALFDTMLLQVAKDDDKAIPNDKNWLYNHPMNALIFSKTEMVWNTLKKVYSSSKFNELLIGKIKPPTENEVFETLVFLSKRIEEIEWDIKE
ncbi:nucleotidyl transferase AbiEii/AbiGii toxin family protein [Flavobacterium sp. 20NA77.7]|uniref:Nucleotidyl transferase AbiEii/AbiGii toxin family protein n=1 Tax=Flavobacterium nakdongensis TaxID=3073563 RepID=A0ABY9RCQ4_9FLAO|nr:nucleotidyl transferase AbiEii/AbiGii toxin family protein [Flavobacterium sp. 20NA77.7]WMW78628.1 nucleotidyl transferase AbiEii/AbiGii toxin family protein [Flavobacterium sp. 20NA77.7]